MIKACRKRGDQPGVAFWSHALLVTETLKDAGQSEEEDGTVDLEVEGVMMKQNVKKVSRLYWREPNIENLYKIADSAPGVETSLFHRAGAARIPRIRTDKVDHRAPPIGLPRCFYREEYLSALMPHDLLELKLADYNIEMYDFSGYEPNAPEDQAMDTS
ncbi:uncharacterized protein C8R40DRAFT_1047792 [Lentinula edodes]|uniref:uncharacterized protein n=1 Tax=Lentinula edodes TaxID=5353 RepID=UPI001E8D0672|nr:uncharacterized protein C8R40DRAFT_1047792 [Lentinula edodes]KAH7874286.1 hypothetical protein C8R40DRAFT_1047792 [Lentinula edodes]